MELSIDLKKKKEITKQVIHKSSRLKAIRYVSLVFVILGVGIGIVFFATNLLVPGGGTAYVQGTNIKDMQHIISTSVLIMVIGVFIWVALQYLLKNLSGKEIEERIEESCVITDNTICYSFRIKYQSSPVSKILVSIPFRNIRKIDYDTESSKILIKGDMSYEYYDNYKPGVNKSQNLSKIDEWVFYDYFLPSLYQIIKSHEIA